MKAIHTLAFIAASVLSVTSTPLSAAETDERIESSFSKSYAYRTFLQDDAIKTVSKDGVVTLSGQVNEESDKYLAQAILSGLPGVKAVNNHLEVRLEGTDKSDTWIRAKVRSVLALHRKASGSQTEVDIKDGVITLRGAATSEAQRELATEYAEDVNGVLGVTNLMTPPLLVRSQWPCVPIAPPVQLTPGSKRPLASSRSAGWPGTPLRRFWSLNWRPTSEG
jgi:osmotically-inducible protein OsmY